MILRKLLLYGSLLSLSLPALAGSARSFSLSTSKTFSPGESVRIQLLARNVPELEFRVYKVRDTARFFSGLKDIHSFGMKSVSPEEQIDRRSWIERIHDWKAHLWYRVRSFSRGQFSDDARDYFREEQGKLGRQSRVVAAAEFAQVPILNDSQLVARWRLETPPALLSETDDLPIKGLGSGVYLIEATDGTYKAYTVAIVTPIAVIERNGPEGASLFVVDRRTGAPVAGADLSLWTGHELRSSDRTGDDGLATLPLRPQGGREGAEPEDVWVLARRGPDEALVTPLSYSFVSGGRRAMAGYVFTDRPVYRPGHTVHIKAIVRRDEKDELLLPDRGELVFEVRDSDDGVVLHKDVTPSAHGTVTLDLSLEGDAKLGLYSISLRSNGENVTSGSFYVEEYKRPEYQVTVRPAAARVLQGNRLEATIEARYFFGEPVAGAKVKYVVHSSTHSWWEEDEDRDGDQDQTDAGTGDEAAGEPGEAGDLWGESEKAEKEGVLDASGRLTVRLPVALEARKVDDDLRIEARVTDEANREVSGHSSVLATYGSFHLRVEPVSYVIENGRPAQVRVTAEDYDGKPVETGIHVTAALEAWSAGQVSKTPVAQRDATTGPDGSVLVDLPIQGNGSFEITAAAVTPERRTVEGRTWVWEWHGQGEAFTEANTNLRIVSDKTSYQVGEVAHMLLVTGVKDSWALVTVEGNSVQSRRVIHADGASTPFDVPISRTSQPNLVVSAVVVRNDQVLTATKSLKVPLIERALTVTATPSKPTFLPGEQGSFDVFVADAKGQPVQADLSFGEVDEALYSVHPDTSGDILRAFYPQRAGNLETDSSLEFYFSGDAGNRSPVLAELFDRSRLYHPRMAEVKPGSDLVVPKVRKAFPDTAYWNPAVRTGADGHAHVAFTFPDSLTTWRTTIRAMTDDGKAGGQVSRVVVRKNLIVRLAAPRFFRQGDETVLRVIAHNYLESAREVTFALDLQGLEVVSGQTRKVTVPARGESAVDWRVRSRTTGSAVVTARALTSEESDALEMTLPVLAFGVREQSSGSGVVFSGTGQDQWSYSFPAGSDAGTRGLTITVAPTVAGTVFDALDYLTGYPWGCTEQTMSSFLPDLIVARTVDRLHLHSPIDRATLNEMVTAGLDRLKSFQHDDGGWGWWPDDPSRVFMTAYVVSGLGQARDGWKIDEQELARGRTWLASALSQHPDMVPDLRAYVVYALATTGGAPREAVERAWSSGDNLSDEGLALLGLALDAAGDGRAREAARRLETRASATGVEAHWAGNYDGMLAYWDDTSSETTAFALKLLVHQDRQSGLLPKAARWLARRRSGGYWDTTKQTAMVIEGLTDYLALSGELASESNVEVLVNGVSVGRRHFGSGDALARPWRIRLDAGQIGGGGQVTIRKSGNGLAYWSAEDLWYSADRRLYQLGKVSLNVTRDYFLLRKRQDKPTDPITYDLAPLSGPVHVGDVVAVRLALSGTGANYLLAEDPIPAGTEFLTNPGLYALNHKPDWWGEWFTRKEFHDDRAAFFNTEFNGRREYVYLLKAVNPGRFNISPASAGPMYQPSTQATTDPAVLEVLP